MASHKTKLIVLSLFLIVFLPLVLVTVPWSSIVAEITRPEPKLVYSVDDIDKPDSNKSTVSNPTPTVEKFSYVDDVIRITSSLLSTSFTTFDYDLRVGSFSLREMLYDLTRIPGHFVGLVSEARRVSGKTSFITSLINKNSVTHNQAFIELVNADKVVDKYTKIAAENSTQMDLLRFLLSNEISSVSLFQHLYPNYVLLWIMDLYGIKFQQSEQVSFTFSHIGSLIRVRTNFVCCFCSLI